MANYKGKFYVDRLAKMSGARTSLDSVFDEIAFYCKPTEGDIISDRTSGDTTQIPIDHVGIVARQTTASGLFFNSVSTSEDWFTLRHLNMELATEPHIKEGLQKIATTVMHYMTASNFTLQCFEAIDSFPSNGNAVVYTAWDKHTNRFKFRQVNIKDCYWDEDDDREIHTIYRRLKHTPQQAIEAYGFNNVPEYIQEAYNDESKCDTKYEFVHCVQKRRKELINPKKLTNKHMEYEEVFVDCKEYQIVQESGYRVFPFSVARFWLVDEDAYGRGAGFYALPALRSLSEANYDYSDAIQMSVRPPIFLPNDESISDIDLQPGGVNTFDNTTGGTITQFHVTGDLNASMQYIQRTEDAVKELFYADLFMLLDNLGKGQMTIPELNERMSEKVQAISPVVLRLNTQFFSNIIYRVIDKLAEANLLPEDLPEELNDAEFEIIYTSRLDSMLKMVHVKQLLNACQQSAQLSQMMQAIPDADAIIDFGKAFRYILQSNNTQTDLLISVDESKKIVEAKREAEAQMQGAQQITDKIGQIDPMKKPEDGSALGMLQNMGDQNATDLFSMQGGLEGQGE